TGTAAWTFVNVSQHILGIYPTHNGLQVNPCVPKGFGDFTVTRKYRNTTYNITVSNPDNVEKGVAKMMVNGVEVTGNVIPYDASQVAADVTVVMG
ncbi:MAG: glycosyl transferase, partial [Lachnospiraceae bacterium]|nr:glycosyl transferase [Lachnospiraceae bacterium]